ncbi:hypothetical protein [Sphingomonas aurantiaca]|uniref:hypothetical protein n=1 Tax=Sphingomonas aurantiaca TaxID=185949 RepID=UPI0033559F49
MIAYRLEWQDKGPPSTGRWSIFADAERARIALRQLLRRRSGAVQWVRVVQTGGDGDMMDCFVAGGTSVDWPDHEPLPLCPSTIIPPLAPEIDRLRARAIAALDIVLSWSMRHHVLDRHAADGLRLAFDAALLGVGIRPGRSTD